MKSSTCSSGLGVLYQNKNKVLSIGSLQGVNPKQISDKGVFEKNEYYDIKKAWNIKSNVKGLRILRERINRRQ